MSTRKAPSPTNERKAAIFQICDADSYLPIITGCLEEKQAKLLRPHHMAHFMALSAELYLSNYDSIATAFERNNGLEVNFKARLAPEKDNVEISFKPVDTFKDSASANLPDEDQSTFDFKPKNAPRGAAPVVDAEIVPMGLPAPADVRSLPAPKSSIVIDDDADTSPEQGLVEWLNRNPHATKQKKARIARIEEFIEEEDENALLRAWSLARNLPVPSHILEELAVFCREIDPTGDF